MHIQDALIFCINFGIDFCSIWAPSWCPLAAMLASCGLQNAPKTHQNGKKTVLGSKTIPSSICDWFLVDVWSTLIDFYRCLLDFWLMLPTCSHVGLLWFTIQIGGTGRQAYTIISQARRIYCLLKCCRKDWRIPKTFFFALLVGLGCVL